MRTRTGRAATISAVDAIVTALAAGYPQPIVLTSDPDDLRLLVSGHEVPITVVPT